MFSERLRELREAQEKNQLYIANKIGVSKQTVCNWENGNVMPSVDMLIRLAELFSVTTDYLLGLDNRPTIIVEGLTPQKQAFVQRMIKYLLATDKDFTL